MCHLYCMKQPDSGLVKIGISSNPENRLRQIISASGVDTVLLAAAEHDGRESAANRESELHKKYEEFRCRGEWFNLPDELLENILSEVTIKSVAQNDDVKNMLTLSHAAKATGKSAMVSVRTAAEMTRTSKTTIQRYIKSGKLPATRNESDEWEIDPAELVDVFKGLGEDASKQNEFLLNGEPVRDDRIDDLKDTILDLRARLDRAELTIAAISTRRWFKFI